MSSEETQERIAAWRRDEDRFYASVINNPELYMASIRLVRAVADTLGDSEDLEALVQQSRRIDASYVIPIAASLETPQLALLDYGLLLGAVFHLRSREVVEAQAQKRAAEIVAEARRRGEEWVVLYDEESLRNGYKVFKRLELHLSDGLALHTCNELDWEKGWVYALQPLMLDPQTGQILSGVQAPDPRAEFTTREELAVAVTRLREKYSGTE